MSDDPRIAAMHAATDFSIAKYGTDSLGEDDMFALADRWLAWYESKDVRPLVDVLSVAEEAWHASKRPADSATPPIKQPCGAYLEPDWFRQLPERLRRAYPWLTCANEHSAVNDWHIGAGGVTFATHWCVTAWRDHSSYARCACGEKYGHPGNPMDP